MEVNFNTINCQNLNNSKQNKSPNIYPSFKMKMKELKGIDRFIARKYKIDPQPIKTLKAFQDKCQTLVEDIAKRASEGQFSGRQQETQVQRKAMIKDWYEYVTKENCVYTGAMALMILGGITAKLKPKEDTLPPVLNKGVLASTVEEISSTLPENPDDNAVSFDKKYRLNLQKSMMGEEKALDESLNGWIVIPSKEHDPENFEANVDKLKMLSHDNWCTKSFNAEPYLSEGDFHVYMEQGKPKIGVRFIGDEIEEIQGEKNNSKIPVNYESVTMKHIKGCKLTSNADDEVSELKKAKKAINKFKKEHFPNGIKNASVIDILGALEMECRKGDDGLLIISKYVMPTKEFTIQDLGIDEAKLLNEIGVIEGDADFSNFEGNDIGMIRKIGGNANFEFANVRTFKHLKEIGGNAKFEVSKLEALGCLERIGGLADFLNSKIKSLGMLKYIGGDAWVGGSHLKNSDFDSVEIKGCLEIY